MMAISVPSETALGVRWYDSADGIRACLTDFDGLDGLHRLSRARHEAGYDRKERLHEFLVLGRFGLDMCGNFSHCTFTWDYRRDLDLTWLADGLPLVVPWSDLKMLTKLSITSVGVQLPGSEHLCAECGEGWTLANVHDAVYCYVDRYIEVHGFEHVYCHKLSAEREASQAYRDIVIDAGLEKCLLTPIPNEYENDAAPWCLIRSPKGAIKMGWRKRVINIDWADVVERQTAELWKYDDSERKLEIQKKFNGELLFPAEQVTKWSTGIHAYGARRAAEYLRKLSSVMKIGDYTRCSGG